MYKKPKIIFKNKWITLLEKQIKTDKKILNYYLIRRPDYVAIAPVYQNQILLISQRRYGADKIIKNIPLGVLEKGEKPKDAALRELEEETGIKITDKDLVYISNFYIAPAFASVKGYLFLAKCPKAKLRHTFPPDEEHEFVNMKWYDIERLNMNESIDLTTQLAIAKTREILED